MPARMAISTASRLSTGNAPGRPMHTGQTLVLGSAPKLVGHPQKILVAVASCTCTSRPTTGSYLEISAGEASSATGEDLRTIIGACKSGDKIEDRERAAVYTHAAPELYTKNVSIDLYDFCITRDTNALRLSSKILDI